MIFLLLITLIILVHAALLEIEKQTLSIAGGNVIWCNLYGAHLTVPDKM